MEAVRHRDESQIQLLIRHFLERFLNNEMVSADEEGGARLLLVACTVALPNFFVAVYLWALYHILFRVRPYWDRVGDHYFFVAYSLAAMGIITVFEWDLFFPDLLDLFVLSSLPIPRRRLFLARIAAISIFTAGFLLIANVFSTVALVGIDPPSLLRFLAAHILAVSASGIFAAAFILALQGILLAVFGAGFFRRISLALQGLIITVLLVLLCLSPVLAEILPALVRSGSRWLFYFPPYWFLGIYQRMMEGPAALPLYAKLAGRGCVATLLALGLALLSYPLAYWRRTRQLIEGPGAHKAQSWAAVQSSRLFHTAFCRISERRAVCHFVGQTLVRVQRYRIYFVMYGGLGLSLVIAGILRLQVERGHIRAAFAADGIRAAIPIVVFWTIAGLRIAFLSPGDSRAAWIFRSIHGKPALDHLLAAKHWALAWAVAAAAATLAALRMIEPPELRTMQAFAAQVLVAGGLCLLLADLFFLNVTTIPFTRAHDPERTNLAIVLLKYAASVLLLVLFAPYYESWIGANVPHMLAAVAFAAAAHLLLRAWHRQIVREHLTLLDLEEHEEGFPLRLWLGS
jgi:hypothetical protein